MRFSRYNQPKNRCGARKPSQATIEKRQHELRIEREREQKVFNDFLNAESGRFNGFAFANVFHEQIKKNDAIYSCIANDSAEAVTPFGTFPTSADGVMAYFFSKTPQKIVEFNRSIYFF